MYECIDGAEGHTVVELHVSLWLNGSLFLEFSADFTWGQKKNHLSGSDMAASGLNMAPNIGPMVFKLPRRTRKKLTTLARFGTLSCQ